MTAVDRLEHAEIDVAPVIGAQLEVSRASDPASISAAMQRAFGRLTPYIVASDWMKCSQMWEEYVTDPTNTSPAKLVTYIYVPVPRLT